MACGDLVEDDFVVFASTEIWMLGAQTSLRGLSTCGGGAGELRGGKKGNLDYMSSMEP